MQFALLHADLQAPSLGPHCSLGCLRETKETHLCLLPPGKIPWSLILSSNNMNNCHRVDFTACETPQERHKHGCCVVIVDIGVDFTRDVSLSHLDISNVSLLLFKSRSCHVIRKVTGCACMPPSPHQQKLLARSRDVQGMLGSYDEGKQGQWFSVSLCVLKNWDGIPTALSYTLNHIPSIIIVCCRLWCRFPMEELLFTYFHVSVWLHFPATVHKIRRYHISGKAV